MTRATNAYKVKSIYYEVVFAVNNAVIMVKT